VRDLPGPTPDAPTVLLLHGWTVTADLNWWTSYRALQQRFRVLAMDHRGHGRGIRSRRPFRLEDCADDAAALCEALGIDRVVACGYSMGGPVAQLLWRRHRDLVAGLVLCATGRRFGSDPQRARIFAITLLGASLATRVASPLVQAHLLGRYLDARLGHDPQLAWAGEQLRRNDPAAVLQAGAALAGFDSRSWISEVHVPTAVVVTTLDQVVAVTRQRNLAAAIDAAVVEEVAGGHDVPVDAPELFVPALLRACTHASSGVNASVPRQPRSALSPIVVRASRLRDGPLLREVERVAGERFCEVGLEHVAADEPLAVDALGEYAAAQRGWVAVDDADEPVGYVIVDDVDGCAHVAQLTVRPDHQGKGVGRALLGCVRAWAAEHDMTAVTLTTFAHVPWNRPLFEHLGFRVLADEELGLSLVAVRRAETARGLDPATRVCMRWSLLP